MHQVEPPTAFPPHVRDFNGNLWDHWTGELLGGPEDPDPDDPVDVRPIERDECLYPDCGGDRRVPCLPTCSGAVSR